MEKQPSVKVIEQNDEYFIFICLNETRHGNDDYSSVDGETEEISCWEYDYNEFHDKKENIDLEDIKNNPEKYLEYPVRKK